MYVRVEKWTYVLVQAGIITQKYLKGHLQPYGYEPEKIISRLWKHQDRDIHLNLLVDNVGTKYWNKKDADHLIAALR